MLADDGSSMTSKDAVEIDVDDVSPYACTLCGCLCDDILLEVEAGHVVKARHACDMARQALIGLRTDVSGAPSPRIRGKDATIEEALTECSRVLRKAQSPLIMGVESTTNETARAAVGLADRLGGTIEIGDSSAAWARIAALQRAGSIGSTLGEVKARADVIVFWACDPATTHPRHFERHSIDAPGRFVAGGRAGRRVIVIDEEETPTARRADHFIRLEPGRELNLLSTLRALVRGAELESSGVLNATGHRVDALQDLVATLQGARYGAWFSGAFAGRRGEHGAEARHQAMTGLVRELARRTRFVCLGLGEAGNPHGAEGVLAWQSGFAPAVDFAAGFPRSLPGETSAAGRLARGEFDAALVLGGVAEAMEEHLRERPWIFIGSPEAPEFDRAEVALPAGRPGIDDFGTFTRVDGVALPIRALRPPSSPSAREWLGAIGRVITESKEGVEE